MRLLLLLLRKAFVHRVGREGREGGFLLLLWGLLQRRLLLQRRQRRRLHVKGKKTSKKKKEMQPLECQENASVLLPLVWLLLLLAHHV